MAIAPIAPLDYSFRQSVTVSVSGVDMTSCFKSLQWALPAHEPESPLTWTAELTLALTAQAQQLGLTWQDLDPLESPARWGQGVGRVVVNIAGTQLVFRVDNWRYDSQRSEGSGSLSQQIELYDQAIPELDPELVYTNVTNSVGTSTIISRLLSQVAAKSTQSFTVGSVDMIDEAFWGMRSTRNPLGEVQAFAKPSWAWLCQSLQDETVNVKRLDYLSAPLAFARPAASAQVVPDLNNISFVAPRVIAHGSADVPDDCNETAPSNANDKGLPKIQVTQQTAPAGVIFPKLSPDTTLYVSQRKTVRYMYVSDISLIAPEFPPKIFPPITINDQGLYRTETIIEEPKGKIFPKLGTVIDLAVSSRLVETAHWKAVWRPRGILFPKLGNVFDLELESFEVLQTDFIKPGGGLAGRTPDGRHGCIDKAKPEQPIPVEVKLRPAAYKGEVDVSRPYTAALDYPLIYNMGFCPSNASAQLVASRLAIRETSRHYADSVILPLPLEWLALGCPHFCRAQIGTKRYYVDAPLAEITCDEQGRLSASLSFTGCLLDTADALPAVQVGLYNPAVSLDLTQSWPESMSSLVGTMSSYQL